MSSVTSTQTSTMWSVEHEFRYLGTNFDHVERETRVPLSRHKLRRNTARVMKNFG